MSLIQTIWYFNMVAEREDKMITNLLSAIWLSQGQLFATDKKATSFTQY